VVDAFRESCSGPPFKAEGDLLVSRWISKNEDTQYPSIEIIAIKPKTYINLSGKALLGLKKKLNLRFKTSPAAKNKMDELIVISDQTHLDFPEFEIKCGQSAGGHNGVKGIIDELKFKNFLRIEIGINRVYLGKPRSEWVLEPFTREERKHLPDLYNRVNLTLLRHIHGNLN